MSDRQTGPNETRFSGYLLVLVIAALIAIAGLIIWYGAPQGT